MFIQTLKVVDIKLGGFMPITLQLGGWTRQQDQASQLVLKIVNRLDKQVLIFHFFLVTKH